MVGDGLEDNKAPAPTPAKVASAISKAPSNFACQIIAPNSPAPPPPSPPGPVAALRQARARGDPNGLGDFSTLDFGNISGRARVVVYYCRTYVPVTRT